MIVNATQPDQNIWVLEFSGKLNFHARHVFQNSITKAEQASPRQIILDLTDLSYIDSAGLGLLTLAHRELSTRNICLEIANPQTVVRDVLLLTNMDKIFAFHESVAAASQGLKAIGTTTT